MLARLGAARLPGGLPRALISADRAGRRRAGGVRVAPAPAVAVAADQHGDEAPPRERGAASRGLRLLATGERGTVRLARLLAADVAAGDCYCLLGEVGAGKSALSRAFIRSVMQDDSFPVPSPTYLLQNTYDEHDGPPVHHFDLYRLSGEADMGRLSLGQSLTQAVSLVEWAERLQGLTPADRMDVCITAMSQDAAAEYAMYAPSSSTVDLEEAVDDEEWGEGEDEDGEEYMQFVDRKWRLLELAAHGERMAGKLAAVRAQLATAEEAGGPRFALVVLPDLPGNGAAA